MVPSPTESPSRPDGAAQVAEPAPLPDRTQQRAADQDPLHEIVGRVRDITRANEQLFARLIEGERRFRGLAKAVWKVQEDERRRLARELHDGLGQTLTALTHQLERLREKAQGCDETAAAVPADFVARLADSVEMARLALNETRELSRLLRPPVLDDLGLSAALTWLARTLEQRTGLQVELEFEVELDLPVSPAGAGRLDPDLETLVFRIVQEALTNVLRHAGVGRAQVVVRRAGQALELRVADAGKGFDALCVLRGGGGTAGSGLRGMRDRLELFGGRLEVVSAPGQGTVLSAAVPLVEATL